MDEEAKKYHLDVLSQFNTELYANLVQPHHITSNNLKEIEFENWEEDDRGYFAHRDRQKYWITEDVMKQLPIRIIANKELKYKEDIVLKPVKASTFRIKPEQTMKVRMMVDNFAPFTHTHPDQWLLLKIITLASYIGKTFICIASEPHFGKSSTFKIVHALTDKCPVFKPRSTPGVLHKITETGNMVFDEAHESKKEVRDIMEEFALDVGGGSTVYINGALKSAFTKNRYNCRLQSITFLYNNVHCYREPEKKYFENIFSNNKAMDDRFLKFKFSGRLTQIFSRDFDIKGTAMTNKHHYINFHKQLLWLQDIKQTGGHDRKFIVENRLRLKGRKKVCFDELTWLLDLYCETRTDYERYVRLLERGVESYTEMIQVFDEERQEEIKVEQVEED